MTVLGNYYCRFIKGKKTARQVDLEAFDLHKRMSGDGDIEGNKVLTYLATVVERIKSGTS